MDRFLMHITIDYPSDASEKEIVRLVRSESAHSGTSGKDKPEIIPQSVVFDARREIDGIGVSEAMEDYLVALIAATRRPSELSDELGRWIAIGASPRGSLALDKASRAHAWMEGRPLVSPDDIRAIVHDCLRHRLTLTYEATADGVNEDDVISRIVELVPVV